MTKTFEYSGLPAHVIFGYDTLDCLAEEVEKLGAKRALVLPTPEMEEQGGDIAERLGPLIAGA